MSVLLISDYGKDPDEWQSSLRQLIPGLEVRGWPQVGNPSEIDIVLADCPAIDRDGFGNYQNLGWVHYLGHGVGDMLKDPSLPANVTVTRQKRAGVAQGLAIYVVNALTNHHLRTREYAQHQHAHRWQRLPVPGTSSLKVLVLGLGIIGATTARRLLDLGYDVTAWSRSGQTEEALPTLAGLDKLDAALTGADYVVGALPETEATIRLLNASRLARMKTGAYIINIGRGSLIDEASLLDALNTGQVSGAALDVFSSEPLPDQSELWGHPRITLTPHVGGPPADDGDEIFAEIAENFRRFRAGEPMLNVANRELGY